MKRLGIIALAILFATIFINNSAFAEENYFAELEKDLVNGELIIKSEDPKVNPSIFEVIYGMLYKKYNLSIDWDYQNKDYYNVTFQKYDKKCHNEYYSDEDPEHPICSFELVAEKPVKLSYTGVDQSKKQKIMSVVNPIAAKHHWGDWENLDYYKVTDLSFVNYVASGYIAANWAEDIEQYYYVLDRMASFSDEYRKDFDNKNIQLVIDNRAGDGDAFLESAVGFAAVMSDGYIYDAFDAVAAQTIREIYIPTSTPDTHDDYITAAQKRIDDYYKGTNLENKFKISYGGWSDALGPYGSDDYYYLEYNGIKIDVYLKKNDNYTVPNFATSDVNTDVSITTSDPTIPLDTAISVDIINGSDRKEDITNLGLTDADIYNIGLFSITSNNYIHLTESGMFEVRIPIPKKFEGKQLHVYYLTVTNGVEEYEVTVENGYAIFYTNHFSEYILGTDEEIANPQTIDTIKSSAITLTAAGVIILISLKRHTSR